MEKLWNVLALPYLLLFEWLRDHPRRVTPAQDTRDGIPRHDGTGRTWPAESSALDALRTLAGEMRYCGHRHTGRACSHAAEPPSASDALAAYGVQRGRHCAARASQRVPADWTPPTGARRIRASLEDTGVWSRADLDAMLTGAR